MHGRLAGNLSQLLPWPGISSQQTSIYLLEPRDELQTLALKNLDIAIIVYRLDDDKLGGGSDEPFRVDSLFRRPPFPDGAYYVVCLALATRSHAVAFAFPEATCFTYIVLRLDATTQLTNRDRLHARATRFLHFSADTSEDEQEDDMVSSQIERCMIPSATCCLPTTVYITKSHITEPFSC